MHGVLLYLGSILPPASIVLSQVQPPHCALSMFQVVLPLTRVKVARGEAVKTQVSHLDHINKWGKKNLLVRSRLIHTFSLPIPLYHSSPSLLCTRRSYPGCKTLYPKSKSAH